jgi:hypothetical protein
MDEIGGANDEISPSACGRVRPKRRAASRMVRIGLLAAGLVLVSYMVHQFVLASSFSRALDRTERILVFEKRRFFDLDDYVAIEKSGARARRIRSVEIRGRDEVDEFRKEVRLSGLALPRHFPLLSHEERCNCMNGIFRGVVIYLLAAESTDRDLEQGMYASVMSVGNRDIYVYMFDWGCGFSAKLDTRSHEYLRSLLERQGLEYSSREYGWHDRQGGE